MKKYDIILIGTGQATGTILPGLLDAGKRIAVIERDRVGGSCVNWGCTPTKTLVASARAARMVQRAGEFGIETGPGVTDFSRVMERVNSIRNEASTGFQKWLEEVTDFYPFSGSFVDEHTVKAGDELIQAETIIIHTGAAARIPQLPGIESVPWLDNKRILDLTELPAPPRGRMQRPPPHPHLTRHGGRGGFAARRTLPPSQSPHTPQKTKPSGEGFAGGVDASGDQ